MRKIKDIFFGGKDILGEVGIEIEMEGENFIMEDLDFWYSRDDGSLRGNPEGKREYVLIRPCKREGVNERLNSLEADLKEFGAKVAPSYRTGVHVHINIRGLSYNELWAFIFTYLMFEEALMKFCGDSREGNLFCLRNKDAEGLMIFIEKAIENKDLSLLYTNNIRYSSMNLKAIKEYGSLEFRGLPFLGDFNNISQWIDILLAIKDWSLTLDSPVRILEQLSLSGGENLAKEVLKTSLFFMPKVDWGYLMLEGARRIQKLVYTNDWEGDSTSLIIKAGLKPIPNVFRQAKPVILRDPIAIELELAEDEEEEE